MRDAFIVDAVRTPRAKRKGKFSSVHPVDLLTYPLNALVERNSIEAKDVEDVAIGCVTQTGEQAWCVARAAVLAAGWPISVPATTINRLCGSGQQATNFIAAGIQSGMYELAVSGGLEHMTRVPMFSDSGGEESPMLKKEHPELVQQGLACEMLAERFGIERQEIDEFALRSQQLAKQAIEEGRFERSLIPVPFSDEEGNEAVLSVDDNPRFDTSLEALAGLKTVFKEEGGVITAGNASAIVDGAASLLLASGDALKKHGLNARAKIRSMVAVGSDPLLMLTGPIPSSQLALQKAGLTKDDIELWEINEAFAPVVIHAMRELELPLERVNVNGGAIALGHPLGATGAILLGTLVDELERQDKTLGLVTMCIGLGMGIATVIERV